MSTKTKSAKPATRTDAFRELVRKVGCDDDEEAFADRVSRMAKAPKTPVEKHDND